MHSRLRKRFGQHLLVDQNTIANIVHVIQPKTGDTLIEIGPGRGAITIPVLRVTGFLHAIEIDRDIAKEVTEKCKSIGNLILHQTDVLNFDFNQIENSKRSLRLFGNLPYNISTPLLFHLIKFSDCIIDMHFMLQKEVVERITALTGNSHYSRLSIMVQSNYEVESLFDISPEQFSPPPKVNSSFLRLVPTHKFREKIKDQIMFNTVVETAFKQRRKTIKNSLLNLANEEQFSVANIIPTQRPQEISIQQYIKLSNELVG